MKPVLVAASSFALACLLVTGSAKALDDGEVRAVEYQQRQTHCATVPRFAEHPALIGAKTGDPEKDTIAYPVERLDTLCPAKAATDTAQRDTVKRPQ